MDSTDLLERQIIFINSRFPVGFLPNATAHIAHHILIYGCSVPGFHQRDTPHAVWDCGEMAGEYIPIHL